MNIDPVKLNIALSRQADRFNQSAKDAQTSESIVINSTIAMLLYSLSIALAEASITEAAE